ncbi:hypothetical protein [Sansalvadorimonas verongulae]|uniref:hypothetical protein n=1 Tax=Sansalvadorimonas verongulae TaxID=2172824 RepID=UPI0012BBE695|nr:hypothetical protein [Sansalvadorimonas verongulae]MTI13561.1 hypothetical protein [Sansalvadorimonas verongulae]
MMSASGRILPQIHHSCYARWYHITGYLWQVSLYLLTFWCTLLSPLSAADTITIKTLPKGLRNTLPLDVHSVILHHGSHLSRSLFQLKNSELSSGQKNDPNNHWLLMAQDCLARLAGAEGYSLLTQLQYTQWLIVSPVDLSDSTPGFILSGFSAAYAPTLRVNCHNNSQPTAHIWSGEFTPVPSFLPHWFVVATPKAAQRSRFSPISLLTLIPGVFPQIRNHVAERRHKQLNKIRLYEPEIQKQFAIFRDKLANPHHINGNAKTKKGVLAEHLEVANINAKAIARGLKPPAKKEKSATHPVDLYIDDTQIQAKCYDSASKTLRAVKEHAAKYKDTPSFLHGVYMIPKDQYLTVVKALTSTAPLSRSERHLKTITEELLKRGERSLSLNQFLRPLSVTGEQAELKNINSSARVLEAEARQLHQDYLYKNMNYFGAYSFVSGLITGAVLETATQITKGYFSEEPIYSLDGLGSSVAWTALSSASTGTMTFYLTALISLPAPISGAVANSIMRTLGHTWQYYWSREEQRALSPKLVNIIGQELAGGIGATFMQGYLTHEIAGAYGGILLWHLIHPSH